VVEPITWSPTFRWVTPLPMAEMTPANSAPGENGSSGLNWYLFWMIRTSGKFTPAAFMSTTISPAPGTGSGTSSTTSVSGSPYCLHSRAFIGLSWYFLQ